MPSSPSNLFFSLILPNPTLVFLLTLTFSLCHSIDDQGQALLEWKKSLNISSSSSSTDSLKSWNEKDLSPCNWFGVKCNQDSQVIEISLKSLDLQGSLPSNFKPLMSLQTLVLASTNLTGAIPPELGDCPELSLLDFSDNFLSGEIPAEIFRLKNLRSLSLNTNFLEGEIAGAIGNLSSLEYLTLYDNKLAGEIPKSIGELKKLQVFRAGGNKDLRGELPWEIGNCESLVVLGLAETSISGSLPASIGKLSRVETIALYTSLLSGPIPDEIGNCSELINLYLYQNSISGSIPRSIGRLKKLDSLLLWQNSLVGSIPEEIGGCAELRVVDFSENLIAGAIPTALGELSKLEELQLSANKLSGEIPAEISNCKALTHLELDNNELSGEVPSVIGELKRLTLLFAWQNNLSGNIPESLADCSELQALDLSYNSLSGEVPKRIFGLRNLTQLLLLSNQLSGFIPPDIRNCTNLYRLRLNQNRLGGAIPPEIGYLTNLNFLDLSQNRLSGSIPGTISGCRSLEFLDLHSNSLSGPMPEALPKSLRFADLSRNQLEGQLGSSIGWLTELTKLSLGANRLSGPIPREIQSCGRLQLLDLGDNLFSGEIPGSLGRIPSLEISLNLSCNSLSGELPSELAGLDKLAVLDISHNNLSGGLAPLGSLENLIALNLSSNSFSGELPDTPFFRSLPLTALEANPGLSLSGGTLPGPAGKASSAAMKLVTSVLISASAVLVLVAAYMVIRTKLSGGESPESGEYSWEVTLYQKLELSIDEVVRQLTSSNVIGTGSSGVVYRVSECVAVKKMWSPEEKEAFGTEITTLSSIRHKNIIRLLGWGSNRKLNLLFYDYLPNGSLSSMLHGAGKVSAEWESRYEVVLGVAHALAYLHHDCVPPIMHGDVKAMNVLLGPKCEPFLADFGLARILLAHEDGHSCVPSKQPPIRPHLAGSYGYMAPEHGSMRRITEKSDVYSFGVVLLEVLTGRHPLDPTLPGGSHLVQWVRDHLAAKKDPSDVLDPRLRGRADPAMHEMLQTLAVSFLCVAARAEDRPAMKDIVAMLKEIRHLEPFRPEAELSKSRALSSIQSSPSPPPPQPMMALSQGSSVCSFAFSDDYSMSK